MSFGIERLVHDLRNMGYDTVRSQAGSDGFHYAIIPGFLIPAGSFAGRVVDLGIPAPADYPRSFGSAVHIKAEPHLVRFESIANVRNVIGSVLGQDWQYWSYAFHLRLENPTYELLSQINEVFRKN